MTYNLTYDVEDIGEFFCTEFECKVHFTAELLWIGAWQIEVEQIDLYEMVRIPTRGDDGLIRTRFVKEARDVPAWLWSIIAREYRDQMEHVAQSAHDDTRWYKDDLAAERADTLRDEIVDRELRGAM